jgi:hypothetical protein
MRLQFVWWFPVWHGFNFHRFETTGIALIYAWTLGLGYLEVRKWRSR